MAHVEFIEEVQPRSAAESIHPTGMCPPYLV